MICETCGFRETVYTSDDWDAPCDRRTLYYMNPISLGYGKWLVCQLGRRPGKLNESCICEWHKRELSFNTEIPYELQKLITK